MDDISLPSLIQLGLRRLCSQVHHIRFDVTRGHGDVTTQDLEHLKLFAAISLHFVAFR